MNKKTVLLASAAAAAIFAAAIADWAVPKIPGVTPGTTTEKVVRYAVLGAVGAGAVWAALKYSGQ